MSKILIVSDMHVGSKYALAPDNFNTHRNNAVQKTILSKWEEMASSDSFDYLILNGDLTDGLQKACNGKDVWTTDIDEQIDAAVELINKIDYDKLLVAYGTPYHTGENLNADAILADKLNADFQDYEINFQPKGQSDIFHIAHSINVSLSSWQYRTTSIAKELVAALLNEKELYKYRGVIRSHAHYYCKVDFSNSFGIVTPCWQTRTPYLVRKGLQLIPKLGWVTLSDEEGDWTVGAHCFNIPRPDKVEI